MAGLLPEWSKTVLLSDLRTFNPRIAENDLLASFAIPKNHLKRSESLKVGVIKVQWA